MTGIPASAKRSIGAIPLFFYGYALHKAWISIEPSEYATGFGGVLASGLGLSIPLFAIVLAIVFYRWDSPRLRRLVLAGAVAMQVISTLLLIASPSLPFDLIMVALAIQSIGAVIPSALWIDQYASMGPVRAAFAQGASVLLSVGVVYLLESNAPDRIAVCSVVLPLASGACCLAAARSGVGFSSDDRSRGRLIVPHRVMIFIGAYSFAYGVASAFDFAAGSVYTVALPAAVVVFLVLLDARKFSLALLFRLAFALMAGGFLLVSVIPGSFGGFASFMFDAGYDSMKMLLPLAVYAISYSTGASAIWLFGILSATQFFARLFGAFAGDYVEVLFGAMGLGVVEITSVVLVVIASYLLLSEKSLFSFWESGRAVERESLSSEEYFKTRVEFLGASYALTPREKEMVVLLAQGKTNAEIALESFISEGTVKVHLHNAYRKLGVHSRKELMALVERD